MCILMSHIRPQLGWFHSILIQKSISAICDARLIYGRGRISPVFICGAALSYDFKYLVFHLALVSQNGGDGVVSACTYQGWLFCRKNGHIV